VGVHGRPMRLPRWPVEGDPRRPESPKRTQSHARALGHHRLPSFGCPLDALDRQSREQASEKHEGEPEVDPLGALSCSRSSACTGGRPSHRGSPPGLGRNRLQHGWRDDHDSRPASDLRVCKVGLEPATGNRSGPNPRAVQPNSREGEEAARRLLAPVVVDGESPSPKSLRWMRTMGQVSGVRSDGEVSAPLGRQRRQDAAPDRHRAPTASSGTGVYLAVPDRSMAVPAAHSWRRRPTREAFCDARRRTTARPPAGQPGRGGRGGPIRRKAACLGSPRPKPSLIESGRPANDLTFAVSAEDAQVGGEALHCRGGPAAPPPASRQSCF